MAEQSDVMFKQNGQPNTEGYALAIAGQSHVTKISGQTLVFMERNTPYRIRLSNANSHVCMVTVEMDSFTIGTFLLQPFSKCDVERPADRPLGFIFLQTPPDTSDSLEKAKERKPKNKSEKRKEISYILAIFKPETRSKILQIEYLNKTERLELICETTGCELFKGIRKLFGDWIMSPTCALVHWTNADFDSPVDEILRAESNAVINSLRRPDDPIRKMSLVSIEIVEIHIEGRDVISYGVDSIPTFGKALEKTKLALNIVDQTIVYFQSASGRYLCSSAWLKSNTRIFYVMHRDEILGKPGSLVLRASVDKPAQLKNISTRMVNGDVYKLEAVPETTIRECRTQLESISGQDGDESRWLYDGKLLDTGRKMSFYGISDRSPIDVVSRMPDSATFNSLEMRDTVCVDGDKPVNTSEMIQRDDSRCQQVAAAKKKKKKAKRTGSTSLRGRVQKQYMEVGPVETDERFATKLAVTIIPKEKEKDVLSEKFDPQRTKSIKACSVS